MSRESLDRAITLKSLAQAEEPIIGNSFYGSDLSQTTVFPQRTSLLTPTAVNDMIWDNGGNDVIDAGAGNDWMIAGRGADSYNGGTGFDIVAYVQADRGVTANLGNASGTSPFRDFNSQSFAFGDRMKNVEGLIGSKFDDVLHGFSGAGSYLNGFDGDDSLFGGTGADQIRGGKGDDVINSFGGCDRLSGGAGNDTLSGGKDAVMSGGAGNDTFVFHLTSYISGPVDLGNVVISDWGIGGDEDAFMFDGQGDHIIFSRQSGDDVVMTFGEIAGSIKVLNASIWDSFDF